MILSDERTEEQLVVLFALFLEQLPRSLEQDLTVDEVPVEQEDSEELGLHGLKGDVVSFEQQVVLGGMSHEFSAFEQEGLGELQLFGAERDVVEEEALWLAEREEFGLVLRTRRRNEPAWLANS